MKINNKAFLFLIGCAVWGLSGIAGATTQPLQIEVSTKDASLLYPSAHMVDAPAYLKAGLSFEAVDSSQSPLAVVPAFVATIPDTKPPFTIPLTTVTYTNPLKFPVIWRVQVQQFESAIPGAPPAVNCTYLPAGDVALHFPPYPGQAAGSAKLYISLNINHPTSNAIEDCWVDYLPH